MTAGGRAVDDGSLVIVVSAEGSLHLQRAIVNERARRHKDGLPWPAALSEVMADLVESEAEAKRHAGLPAASVAAWLGSSSLDRMTTRAAATRLGRSVRRVQQLVADGELSSPARGVVLRGEVEALLVARESRGA